MRRFSHAVIISGVAILLLAMTPIQGRAQSSIPQPGFGSVTTTYQYTHVNNHLFSSDAGVGDGNRADLGHIDAQNTQLTASYCPLRGFSTWAGATYIAARFLGNGPEHPADTRMFHGQIQDGTIGANYTAAWKGIAVTPSATFSFPLASYLTHGHTAVGRGQNVIGINLSAARLLDPVLPSVYAQVSVGHDSRPKIQSWDMNANDYSAGLGYLVNESIAIGGHFAYSQIKGGFDWANGNDWSAPNADELHDKAAGSLVRNAGGSVNYRFNSTYSLGLDVSGVVSGANTHDGMSYSLVTNYGFWAPFTH